MFGVRNVARECESIKGRVRKHILTQLCTSRDIVDVTIKEYETDMIYQSIMLGTSLTSHTHLTTGSARPHQLHAPSKSSIKWDLSIHAHERGPFAALW